MFIGLDQFVIDEAHHHMCFPKVISRIFKTIAKFQANFIGQFLGLVKLQTEKCKIYTIKISLKYYFR